jgi:hypothetical protein
MNVKVNDTNYFLKFCYPNTEHHRYTQCEIYREVEPDIDNELDELLGIGKVSCYYKDPYNKVIGRKQALKDAMEWAGLDKETRTQIWEQYKSTCRYVA